MDLSSGINCNLVAGGDSQTRIVSRTVVHETFAGSRISLFVDCTLEGNLLGYSGLEVSCIWFIHKKNVRRLRAGGDIGTGGRKTVFYVGASERFGVERLNVEDNGNDVQLQPEASTKVGCLVKV